MNKIVAIIVAGGKGGRINSTIPKQFIEINGKSIIQQTIERFLEAKEISSIQVVINKNYEDEYTKIMQKISSNKLLPYCFGGKEFRGESVLEGLKAVEKLRPDFVLIHDAVRPFVDNEIISRVVEKLAHFKAVAPAISVKDSVKKVVGGGVENISRDNLFLAQTPQGFNYKELFNKLKKIEDFSQITDEISLFSKEDIGLVAGSEKNFKITSDFDLSMAQNMGTKTLIGSGTDVHKFIDGEFIILGGVKIPYHKKLDGHSDADVLIHALVDAILGAIGEGDIGEHFADSNPKWKGADSSIFLHYALDLLNKKGGQINNIDATILAQAPKISHHKTAIRENLSRLLSIDAKFINIKATTTEGLGFIGRKEGIMASVVVSVQV
ncbi:MAG: 2-C-methyl-D-erythritol 2,4-cyclodiphosphate synthase [Alphaproteobacteria bacterium]|jgi:2-C-methyl-D-erythritol 4-phosphate cytidylyltransferase/2-C-methyl-D-erythritol 2,4-cyclodiphosphate synthase